MVDASPSQCYADRRIIKPGHNLITIARIAHSGKDEDRSGYNAIIMLNMN